MSGLDFIWTILKVSALIFLLTLFVLIFEGAVFTFSSKDALLTPTTYSEAFEKNGVYDTLSVMIAEETSKSMNYPGMEEEVKTFTKDIVSPAFMKQQTETLLKNAFDYVNGKTNSLNLKISIPKETVKEKLKNFILTYVSKLPSCTPAQILDPNGIINPDGTANCIPPTINKETIADQMITEQEKQNPNAFNLSVDFNEATNGEIAKALSQIRQINEILLFILLAGVAAMIFIITIVLVICRKSLKSAVKWIGLYLFMAGAVGISLAFMMGSIIPAIIAASMQGIPAQFETLIVGTLSYILGLIATNALLICAIVTILGALMIVVGIFILKKPGATKPGIIEVKETQKVSKK
ncbi:MAG: hypothetical protein AABW59_03280 [archaeon]